VKTTFLFKSDVEVRKHGEQMGLETPVVHAVNDECVGFFLFINKL